MLTHQELRYDASNGDFGAPREQAIPLGSRILKVATDLDQLESGGMPRPAAVEALKGKWGWYDPALLEALAPAAATPMLSPMLTPMLQPTAATPDAAPAFAPAPTRDIDIEIRKLEVGMTVREDIRTAPGRMLISRGQVATAEHIRSIKGALGFNELRQLVRVTPVETAARPARRAGGMFG